MLSLRLSPLPALPSTHPVGLVHTAPHCPPTDSVSLASTVPKNSAHITYCSFSPRLFP